MCNILDLNWNIVKFNYMLIFSIDYVANHLYFNDIYLNYLKVYLFYILFILIFKKYILYVVLRHLKSNLVLKILITKKKISCELWQKKLHW